MRILILPLAALLWMSATPAIAQSSGNRWLDECNGGMAASCTNYAISLGHKKDYQGALKYSEQACQMGSKAGCTNAENYASYRQAVASQVTSKSSAAELQSACSKGNGHACSIHAYNKGVAKNWSEAITYAQKGCQLGDKTACTNLEKFNRNKARDDEQAQRQAQAQAQQQQQAQQQKRSTDYTIPESAYSDANVSGRRSNERPASGSYVGSGSGSNSSSYKPRQQVCTESYTSGSGTNSGQRIVTCR